MPINQKKGPMFSEGDSFGLPKLEPMTKMSQGLQEQWNAWTRSYERAFKIVFPPLSVIPTT